MMEAWEFIWLQWSKEYFTSQQSIYIHAYPQKLTDVAINNFVNHNEVIRSLEVIKHMVYGFYLQIFNSQV